MGFFNRVSNWLQGTGAKWYNAIKNGATTGYSAVKNVAHKVGDIASGIDSFLTSVRDVPIVGEVANRLQDNALYKEAQGLVKSGVKIVDDVGKVGGAVGSAVDAAVQKSGVFKKPATGSASSGARAGAGMRPSITPL